MDISYLTRNHLRLVYSNRRHSQTLISWIWSHNRGKQPRPDLEIAIFIRVKRRFYSMGLGDWNGRLSKTGGLAISIMHNEVRKEIYLGVSDEWQWVLNRRGSIVLGDICSTIGELISTIGIGHPEVKRAAFSRYYARQQRICEHEVVANSILAEIAGRLSGENPRS